MSDDEFDPETDLDISGLEWWEVLAHLQRATVAPRSIFSFPDRAITDEQAMNLIGRYIAEGFNRFDWVYGRPLKIGFRTKDGRSWIKRVDLYDCDSPTPARVTIDKLREDHERKRKSKAP